MMNSATLLLSVPLLFLLSAIGFGLTARHSSTAKSLATRWRVAHAVAHLAPLLAMSASMLHVLNPSPPVTRWHVDGLAWPLSGAAGTFVPSFSVRADALSLVMLTLVTLLGLVITRFSQRYLSGEPGQARYLRAFALTMAAVSLLVIANNLLVVVAAWSVSSVALHQLLTFYPERPQALVAAHKKFLMSRVADVLLFAAAALLYHAVGTLEMDALGRAMAPAVSRTTLEVAGVLLAGGVILRSAQLPFHGWLIQVMEAPTPVSALLHAGIVNIGGFVLVRLGALLLQMEAAQTLLVVVGGLTATLAALVMTTRVTIKVALAWSTCAQMGFMLVECGLGAYDLALLHLVAHSLYKAHAFLSSGRTVTHTVSGRARHESVAPSPARWLLSLSLSLAAVFTVDALLGAGLRETTPGTAAGFMMALALAALLADARPTRAPQAALARVTGGGLLLVAYLLLHAGFGLAVAGYPPATSDVASVAHLGVVVVLFGAGLGVHAWLRHVPDGALARRLYPAVFAGFYLDEVFTRLTFALWPPRGLTRQRPPTHLQASAVGSAA